MRGKCPGLRELLGGEGKPLLSPPHCLNPTNSHTGHNGRCLLDITWSRALLISRLVVLVIHRLSSLPPLCSCTQGRPKELDSGALEEHLMWQMCQRLL